jgi:hypothetical protein
MRYHILVGICVLIKLLCYYIECESLLFSEKLFIKCELLLVPNKTKRQCYSSPYHDVVPGIKDIVLLILNLARWCEGLNSRHCSLTLGT